MGDAPIATVQFASITRSLTSFPSAAADAIEILQELHHCGRPVGLDSSPDVAEHACRHAVRIVGCL